MAEVVFTANLQRHVACPPMQVAGDTVRDVLERVFEQVPRLRGYVVDERGALRKHMVVFVDGAIVSDRAALSDAVGPSSEVYVMQALSGG
jgi:molybdopterin converting factor small subunit